MNNLVLQPESDPVWDATKNRIIVEESPGAFCVVHPVTGEGIPGVWWRVEHNESTVGYAWIPSGGEESDGEEAELSVAITEGSRDAGLGGVVLQELEKKARGLGRSQAVAVVRSANPEGRRVLAWLAARGYSQDPAFPTLCDVMRVLERMDVSMHKTLC